MKKPLFITLALSVLSLGFYIGRNKPLKNLNILIDPGHGLPDPGAVAGNIKEYELTFDVARRVAKKLSFLGANVFMTRKNNNDETGSSDSFTRLNHRVKMSKEVNADLFISIHCNSFGDSTANGIETLYFNSLDLSLAQEVHKALVNSLGLRDRGLVKRTDLFVLNRPEQVRPAILVELGFISNPNDSKVLTSITGRNNAAKGIVEGVQNWIKK